MRKIEHKESIKGLSLQEVKEIVRKFMETHDCIEKIEIDPETLTVIYYECDLPHLEDLECNPSER